MGKEKNIEDVSKEIINKLNKDYDSLAPKDDLKNNYTTELLKKVIDDPKNKNVALSGKYGAGKSSIILSAFKDNKKYKPLYISLGMLGIQNFEFKKKETRRNLRNGEEFEILTDELETISQNIEKSIIQQIIYKEKTTKLPASKIKRIPSSNLIFTFIVLLVIAITHIPFVKETWNSCIDFLRIFSSYIWNGMCNIDKLDWLENLLKTLEPTQGILKMIWIIFCVFVVSKLLENWFRKFELKNLKLLFLENNEIEIGTSEESLINRYMDELVYFFEVTKYNVVVIEDLDRFLENEIMRPKVLVIFQKLKELNQILNSTSERKKDKKKITFLYVIRDDLFYNEEERTKFFDFIIPKIPELTNYNSYAKLRNSFPKEISNAFLQDISVYINDYRVIKNLKNEFNIYEEEIKAEGIEKEKIFAMVLLKNLRPAVYEDLVKDKGKIFEYFENKDNLYSSKVKELKEEISDEEDKIKYIKMEKLKDLNELKLMVLGSIIDYQNYDSLKGISVSIKEFLSEDFEIDTIKDNEISIKHPKYNGWYINENKIFKAIGGKEQFLKRANILENEVENVIKEIKDKIFKHNEEINNLNDLSVSEITKKYDIDDSKKIGDFEFMMIKNGYIDENYKDYCFKFEETDGRKRTDYTYILNVRNEKKTNYNYEIKNPRDVIEELDNKYFRRKNIWNFDILNELICEKDKYKEKLDFFILTLKSMDSEKYRFVKQFIDRKGNNIEEFVRLLQEKSILIEFLKFGLNENDTLDEVIEILLRNNDILLNNDIQNIVREYLIDRTKKTIIFKLDNKVKESLKDTMKIKFIDLPEEIDKEIFEFIYENNLYDLNEDILKYIFKKFEYKSNEYEERSLRIIFEDDKLYNLREYICENKDEYIKRCFSKTSGISNYEEDVLELINAGDIDNISMEILIEKIPGKLYDISQIKNQDLYELVIKYDKCYERWENIYYIYSKNGRLPEYLAKFIEDKISILDYLNQNELNDIELERKLEFLKKLIIIDNIKIDKYKDLVEKIDIKVGYADIKELEKEKIKILVDNKRIEFDKECYKLIKSLNNWWVIDYIIYNINEFLIELGELELDEQIIEDIVVYSYIPFKDKNKILAKIDIELLTNHTLEYIIEHYKVREIIKLSDNLKERIIESDLHIDKIFEFMNKEDKMGTLNEKLKYYIEKLPPKYSYIGNYEKEKNFSLPNNPNVKKLLEAKKNVLNISVRATKNSIIIYNKKNSNHNK